MPFIDSGDRASRIPCLISDGDHVFYCLFMVPVFFYHLIQLLTKSMACHTMCVIVMKKTLCHNICSLSNAYDWTSHDEMAGASILPAEVFFRGRG